MKIAVAKTIKNFVGGQFVRSESGRSFPCLMADGKSLYANLCLSSRKDIRDAVEHAQTGHHAWGGRSAFNRSQILYRMAEMTEGKRAEFVHLLQTTRGDSAAQADAHVDQAIESFVYYAGFCDKYPQLTSSVNPINGPFSNVTSPEPVGVVALILDRKFDFGRWVAQIAAILCSGNSLIVIFDRHSEMPALIAPLAEVFATSDLPAGAINLLSGDLKELIETLAGHGEVRALSWQRQEAEALKRVQELATENLKRIVPPRKESLGLAPILDTVEMKTIWQPMGF